MPQRCRVTIDAFFEMDGSPDFIKKRLEALLHSNGFVNKNFEYGIEPIGKTTGRPISDDKFVGNGLDGIILEPKSHSAKKRIGSSKPASDEEEPKERRKIAKKTEKVPSNKTLVERPIPPAIKSKSRIDKMRARMKK